ncbi:hypothetical protein F2Q69_00048137 [Brassica cretica]|uniref:Uncharacterized protein n=1 Tax=Brassica cretica TaxID=69181 RepID=A0A8S9PSU5_BRACR|nr:hypothetical protein F2Q69_00048137 [Brassica cretica]
MHDGVYSFELAIVSFDIILECSGFLRDPQVLSLRIRVDGYARVVTSSLLYWVIEHHLLNGSRSRWSSILGARYLFRTARYNLSFAEACPAAVVIVSFLLAPGSSARDLWSAEGSSTYRI